MTKADLKYEDGFPANIDHENKIVVQVVQPEAQSLILYTCKIYGTQSRCWLPTEIGRRFKAGLYFL